jgi:hypothetical protein
MYCHVKIINALWIASRDRTYGLLFLSQRRRPLRKHNRACYQPNVTYIFGGFIIRKNCFESPSTTYVCRYWRTLLGKVCIIFPVSTYICTKGHIGTTYFLRGANKTTLKHRKQIFEAIKNQADIKKIHWVWDFANLKKQRLRCRPWSLSLQILQVKVASKSKTATDFNEPPFPPLKRKFLLTA